MHCSRILHLSSRYIRKFSDEMARGPWQWILYKFDRRPLFPTPQPPEMSVEPSSPRDTVHEGSCHCKSIKFTFLASSGPTKITICNCSICDMKGIPRSDKSLISGFQHLIVPKESFTLVTGWENIKIYTFGTHVAKHYFCGTCGISAFYVPRSNPNAYSVSQLLGPC